MSTDSYSVEVDFSESASSVNVVYSDSSLPAASIEVVIEESTQTIEYVETPENNVVEIILDTLLEKSIVSETNMIVEIGIDVQSYGIVSPSSQLIKGLGIDDSEINLNQTWSSEKISTVIASIESGEIHTEDLWIAVNQKVSFVPQTLTEEHKQNVCDNIGVGDLSKDLVSIYRVARGVLN